MHGWEEKLKKERAADNTYIVISGKDSFLCLKINDEFIIKYSDGRKITKIDSLIKI